MGEAKPFFGATPYSLDVKKLEEMYPVPSLTEGRIIPHIELAGVLGIPVQSQRYYGVINSWRAKLKTECNVHLHWEPKTGLKVLNPAELHMATEGRVRTTGKLLVRKINDFKWVARNRDRLDDSGQKRLDHQMMVYAKQKVALTDAMKESAIDLAPIKSLPKPIRQVS